jgi:hypothetical protein
VKNPEPRAILTYNPQPQGGASHEVCIKCDGSTRVIIVALHRLADARRLAQLVNAADAVI